MIRVMIVAPYASLRAGLESLLAEEEDIAVVGAAGGSEELDALLQNIAADVILMDMEEGEGERARLVTLAEARNLSLVMLGEQREDLARLAAGNVTAWAYLRRDVEGSELSAAIRAAASGLVVIDRALAGMLAAIPTVETVSGRSNSSAPGETLTGREREVLQLMAQGLANKQIGGRLSISLHTVKFHVASILSKMGAMSRTEAVTVGARRGLVIL